MQSIGQWFRQLQFGFLIDILISVGASLLCIMMHEISHGLAALWMGDDTAKRQGRLSLNPLRHIDPMGLVMMVLLRFGWAKAVPVDLRRFQKPKIGMALTAAAGPAANVLVMFAAMVLRFFLLFFFRDPGAIVQYAVMFLEYTAILSSGLAVFNLFPIPPLDGSKVLFACLSDRLYMKLMRYERYGMILLAVLLVSGLLDTPLLFLRSGLLDLGNNLVALLSSVLIKFVI